MRKIRMEETEGGHEEERGKNVFSRSSINLWTNNSIFFSEKPRALVASTRLHTRFRTVSRICATKDVQKSRDARTYMQRQAA